MNLKRLSMLIAVFTANLIIKILFIDSRDIALDEPFSIFHSQKDLSVLIPFLNTGNNPPLYEIILHFWLKLFGIEPFWVRLPSVIFSALSAVVILKTGEKFFNLAVGVIASLIFTFSTMHIYFSHEARVYPLMVLLTASSLPCFLNLIKNPSSKKYFILLFLSNLLLIYSHYFGFFVLLAQAVSLVVIPNKKETAKKLFLVFALVGLCFAPMVSILLHRYTQSVGSTWVAPPEWGEIYGNLNRFINEKYSMIALLAAFTVLLALNIKSAKKRMIAFFKNIPAKILLVWFLIPYLMMFFLSYKIPMFIDRYILFTSIPFFLLIAFAFFHFAFNTRMGFAASALLIISMLITINLNPDNNRRIKEAVEEVKKLKVKNTPVFICPNYAVLGFTYYYNKTLFRDYANLEKNLYDEKIYPVNGSENISNLIGDANDVIYFQADCWFQDKDNKIETTLSTLLPRHQTQSFREIYKIHHFSK